MQDKKEKFLAAVVENDGAEINRLIHEEHVDINSRDEEGETALILAIKAGQSGVFQQLCRGGALVAVLHQALAHEVHHVR